MTLDITQPLRLAAGSHRAGSGRGCAMNVISWIMGDKEITDKPSCVADLLTHLIQFCNDNVALHGDGEKGRTDNFQRIRYLSPEHATKLLKIAFDTIGTAVDEEVYPRDDYNFIHDVNRQFRRDSHHLKVSISDEGYWQLWRNPPLLPFSQLSLFAEDYLLLARVGVDIYRHMIGLTKTEHPSNTQVDSALQQMAVVCEV